MQSDWDQSLKNLLVHEGGRVDDPADPGGRTNRGITQNTYNAWRRRKGLALQDVYSISDAEVSEIYRTQYADPIRFDDLPAGVDYTALDGAANSGVTQSIKWLQKALGTVPVDGHFGTVTLDAVNACDDYDALIARMCAARLAFDRSLKTWSRFGRGWSSRIGDVRAVAQHWASGSVGPQPTVSYVEGAHRKALLVDAKTVSGQGLGAAGAGIGTASVTVSQLTDALTPAADKLPALSTIIMVLTVIGALIAVGGIVWHQYAAWKQRQLDEALDRTPVAYAPANDNDIPAAAPNPQPDQVGAVAAPAPADPSPPTTATDKKAA